MQIPSGPNIEPGGTPGFCVLAALADMLDPSPSICPESASLVPPLSGKRTTSLPVHLGHRLSLCEEGQLTSYQSFVLNSQGRYFTRAVSFSPAAPLLPSQREVEKKTLLDWSPSCVYMRWETAMDFFLLSFSAPAFLCRCGEKPTSAVLSGGI